MKIILFFALMAIISIVKAGPYEIRFQQEDGSGNVFGNWLSPNPASSTTGLYAYDGTSRLVSWLIVGSGLTVSSGVLSSTATAQVNSDWNSISGVSQILNKPTNVSAFTNDSGFITSSALSPYLTSATAASTYATQSSVTSGLSAKYDASNPSSYINQAGARSAISLTTTGSGAATYNNSTGVLNVPTPAIPAAQSINDAPGRTLVTATSSTGFQISATRNALACYEGYIATTSTIGGPASAVVSIETSDTNSTTPGDWTTKAQQAYANVIALAVVLNQQQSNNWALCRMIPAGKYVRIRAGSIVGTASVVLNTTQQETLQ